MYEVNLYLHLIFSSSLKEFLPKEYIKQRNNEKKIFQVGFKKELIIFMIAFMSINLLYTVKSSVLI